MRVGSSGQTLIEIAIGMTILSVVLLSATSVAISASQQGSNSYITLQASELAQEGLEQATLYRDYCATVDYVSPGPGTCVDIGSWAGNKNVPGDPPAYRELSTPTWDISGWSLDAASFTAPTAPDLSSAEDPASQFTRYLQLTNVQDSGSPPDYTEVEVKCVVAWTGSGRQSQSVSVATVLTSWNGP